MGGAELDPACPSFIQSNSTSRDVVGCSGEAEPVQNGVGDQPPGLFEGADGDPLTHAREKIRWQRTRKLDLPAEALRWRFSVEA